MKPFPCPSKALLQLSIKRKKIARASKPRTLTLFRQHASSLFTKPLSVHVVESVLSLTILITSLILTNPVGSIKKRKNKVQSTIYQCSSVSPW